MSLTIREEKILEAAVAGEQSPIEPVTRREAIFAKATGADVELPPARNKEEDILSKLAVGYAEGGGGGGYLDMQPHAINITKTKEANPIPLENFELYGLMEIYSGEVNRITVESLLDINNGTIEIAKIENQTTRLGLNAYIEGSGQMLDTENTTYEGSIIADPDEPNYILVSGPGTINAVWISAD